MSVAIVLLWRHNGRGSVSNHQPHDCLLNGLFRRRSKKTSKLRVTGLCARNSPVPGEFPTQMASNAEDVSIWWRHHGNNVKAIISGPCQSGSGEPKRYPLNAHPLNSWIWLSLVSVQSSRTLKTVYVETFAKTALFISCRVIIHTNIWRFYCLKRTP